MNPARIARGTVLALVTALAGCVLFWQRAPLTEGSWLALLWLAPLLAPLPGLVRGKRYTYAWATLLVVGYVALALTEIVADPRSRLATTAILFVSFALFVAMVAYLRLTRERVTRDRESRG